MHLAANKITVDWLDDLSPAERSELDRRAQQIGAQLLGSLQRRQAHFWQWRYWDDVILNWSMRDERLKVQLFRFVDVLPMLRSGDAVTGHLLEYLDRAPGRVAGAARTALHLADRLPITRSAVAYAARISASNFARRFIAGENLKQVLHAARQQRNLHRGFTLDILGEAVASQVEAEQYFRSYVDLIESVSPQVRNWPEDPLVDVDDRGQLPRMNLSIKLSALDSQFDPIDPAGATQRAGARLRELLRVARVQGAFINVDMESYEKKDLTLHVFKQILSEPEFRDVSDVGIVVQCYLRDAERDLIDLRDWARARGTPVWVRLVKGAYWDHETIKAQASGWPVPVWQKKWQSDANFERQTRFVLRNREHLRPALGSHNLRSLAHGIAYAELNDIPAGGLELQMLYGMADPEKQALVARGHRLRIYMPYGDLIPGMAYLVRRLLENTANDSFLRAGVSERATPDTILGNPAASSATLSNGSASTRQHSGAVGNALRGVPSPGEVIDPRRSELQTGDPTDRVLAQGRGTLHVDQQEDVMPNTFTNQPPVDFALTENREAMQAALAAVRSQMPRICPLVINGEQVRTSTLDESNDPSLRSRIVGRFALAERLHVDQAVAAARKALPEWSALGAAGRAEFLRRAADVMRERLFELAAWEVFECGKPWREATADIDEAIDFCEYYAQQAVALEQPGGADVPGEENRFLHTPRGVVAVIAPWNFPLAILTGMSMAALATGNTVVMKPAEQSATMGSLLMEVFQQVGLPPGVLNYLPGRGEVTGAALVEHPDVALVAFTGSRAVGLAINAKAAEVSAGGSSSNAAPRRRPAMVKRVIAEMGGKNAIIVDADADLDEAVLGVAKSAFGYAGQKCSACSRAIVLSEVYDAFLTRLIEATRSFKLGPVEDPATMIGPVIHDESQQRILKYIEIGKQEGRLVLAVDAGQLAEQGSFVGPHIFADVPPLARIAQEEIFGPVLAVIRAANLDEAIQIANDTDYALTGGIFSRSPQNLDRVCREFLVGNLYLNRPITGAMVGRQPFGGFKMSGIGSQAGGREYLLQFVLPRTITEHTVRRGFAPPSEDAGE
jgi:RHH-type proline utilization regulon transcriptional repressor/proline dehydrogenase/delta 1-pyrroline-5-carboxylate dehydrogenase